MAEYSRLAKGTFTANGATNLIELPFQPTTVQLWNYTAYGTPTATQVAEAYWDSDMGQGYALYKTITATTFALVPALTTTLGIYTFSAGDLLIFGTKKQVIAATAATASFNVTAHGYAVGDVVMFTGLFETSTTGMPQLSGIPLEVVTVTDANNFIVNWNTNQSNYTSLSGSPSGAYVMKLLYPFLYAPGVSIIESITTGTTTTITTSAPNNFVVGQQIAFNIPSAWGTVELNELPNTLIPGSPQYYYVTSVISSTEFVCNANTTSATAFTSNVTVAQVKAGLSFPQVKAVGDVNTGGYPYSGGNLYPSPVVNSVSTINGPAIYGSYVNNTFQGFAVGSTVASVSSQVWYYQAKLHDINN